MAVEYLRGNPPLDTAPEHPCVQALRAAGGKLVGAPWFCDGSLLAAGGVPAVAAGPGDIAQAHQPNEFILASQVTACEGFMQRMVEWACQ